MTENEMKIILGGILTYWETLTPAEVKTLLKILVGIINKLMNYKQQFVNLNVKRTLKQLRQI